MVRRTAPYLAALAVALAAVVGLVPRPAASAPQRSADYVVVAGAAGLRWDDVNPTDTPTLWRLAQEGAIGALSVRSARQPTCPADGWLTLGAGNYAQRTFAEVESACPATTTRVDRPDAIGGYLPDQPMTVRRNQALPWGAQPGALAETVRCTAAAGPGAAVAAARPYGRVDRYAPALPGDAAGFLGACVLSMVDLGTVAGTGTERQVAARGADAVLARVAAARPERSLLIVAGLADTDVASRLHVAVAHGAGYAGGWLTSPSTSRAGYLQLIDLAPTALAVLGRPSPAKLFAGAPALRTAGRPAGLAAAVDQLADADREAGAQRRVAGRFFAVLTVGELLLFAAVVPLLRRARRTVGPQAPPPAPRRLVRAAERLLVAAALAVPAALFADLVPWWRTELPGLVFAAVTLAALVVCTGAALYGPAGRRTLGPLGGVAGLAAIAVAADVLTGARLQLNGVAGYSAIAGVRYAGLGSVALGVFIAGALLTAGCLAQRVRRAWRPVVIALVGGAAVVVVGSPYLGADVGGAVALTAGVCIAAAMSTGGWLTFARLAWAVLAGVAVTAGFALLDLQRPAERRGTLGRFLEQLGDGTGNLVMHRTAVSNVVTFATSPLTVLAIGAAAFLGLALLRPWGGLKRLFGLHPPVRGAFAGVAVASLLAGALEGLGLNVAGTAAATALPLATLAALRVLAHADDRTQPLRIDPALTAPGRTAAPPAVAPTPPTPPAVAPTPPTSPTPLVVAPTPAASGSESAATAAAPADPATAPNPTAAGPADSGDPPAPAPRPDGGGPLASVVEPG
jgi:hypothetical protein